MKKNDRFTRIALCGMDTQKEGLVTPRVRKPEIIRLSLQEAESPGGTAWEEKCAGANSGDRQSQVMRGFRLFDESIFEKEQAELQKEMAALDRWAAPFFKEYAPPIPSFRKREELSRFSWRILEEEDLRDFGRIHAGGGSWKEVTIPHYGPPLGKAQTAYRCTFPVNNLLGMEERLFICFDGVDYRAHVFVNGFPVGGHEGFFAPFSFDCTQQVHTGDNVLTVLVENDYVHGGADDGSEEKTYSGDKIYAATGPGWDDPQRGWHHCPAGMGIYQSVYLEKRPYMFLSDAYALPVLQEAETAGDGGTDGIELTVEVTQTRVEPENLSLRFSVYGLNFPGQTVEPFVVRPFTRREIGHGDTFTLARVNEQGLLNEAVPLLTGRGLNEYTVWIPLKQARRWQPSAPWMYEAQIELLDGQGRVLDARRCPFGMRSFEMRHDGRLDGALFLNGRPIRLRGANTMGFEQQDVMRGDFEQLKQDILLAKACNMNFLRLTQRPVQKKIYEYCDRLGMLTQTDLPLFGVLRRSSFAEAVRQAGEMEKLVRSHPCNILNTYINEPFPNAGNAPQRNLTRKQLAQFFDAADSAVHLYNPDRVIKHADGDYDPPDTMLTDNHCYCMWYNGHGIDAGALHKGDWIPVKDGWYYGCGEFGAEGLDSLQLMRERYPKEWLRGAWSEAESPPGKKYTADTWSPSQIKDAQTENFHTFFYDTPDNIADWVRFSQLYQAEAVRWMSEAFRRNQDMISFAVHLFIDAFPAGWMKSIVDAGRNCKPAFFAYKKALSPVCVSLRTDRFSCFAQEEVEVELWLSNDLPQPVENLRIEYEAIRPDGCRLSGQIIAGMDACSAGYIGELVIPTGIMDGLIQVRCKVFGSCLLIPVWKRKGNDPAECLLHDNSLELQTYKEKRERLTAAVQIPCTNGAAQALVQELTGQAEKPDVPEKLPARADTLGVSIAPEDAALKSPAVLLDDAAWYEEHADKLDSWVLHGGRLIFYNLSAGNYTIAGAKVAVRESSMLPMHFVSSGTGHPMVAGLPKNAFRWWYEKEADRITPILERTFFSDGFSAILISGNTDDSGRWVRAMAAGERKVGRGSVIICQLMLHGHTQGNPGAFLFARRLLGWD